MKKIISPSKLALAALGLGLSFSCLNAQVHVVTNGNVGVGTTAPSAKLHIVKDNNNSSYSAYIYTNDASSSSKYGLYNNVTSAGLATKYGILNYVYGNTGTPGYSAYGLYSYTSNPGYLMGHYNSTYAHSTSTSTHYGLYNGSSSYNNSTSYGLYNYQYTATGNTNTRYGIYNTCYNYGTGTQYGIYSTVTGSGTNYAGYFNGDVHVNGNLTWTSDARKKTNVAGVSNALSLIGQLQPKTYDFIQDADMTLPAGKQYGFLAQELEAVLPGLVKTIQNPKATAPIEGAELSEEDIKNGKKAPAQEGGQELEEIKSVNYVALIPILVQAVKEQQAAIEAQQQEIQALRTALENK